MTEQTVEVSMVVEGDTDTPFAQAVVLAAEALPGRVYAQSGKPRLLERLSGYAQAAHTWPWLAMVDLDGDYPCAPSAAAVWAPASQGRLVLAVIPRSVEAWVLADPEGCAKFFGIQKGRVPSDPERLDNPKRALIDLCRGSARNWVRKEVVPREGSGRQQGPLYTARLIEFATQQWSLERARASAPSLDRAVKRLSEGVVDCR